MKLLDNQLQTIQNSLLDSGIKYQDFFEEIYDHYITGIEERMRNGESFEEALKAIDREFLNYKRQDADKLTWEERLTVSVTGLSAMQEEYIENFKEEFSNRQIDIWKSYFLFPRVFILILSGILGYLLLTWANLSLLTIRIMMLAILIFPMSVFILLEIQNWVKVKKGKSRLRQSLKRAALLKTHLLRTPMYFTIINSIFSPTAVEFHYLFLIGFLLDILTIYKLYKEKFVLKWI